MELKVGLATDDEAKRVAELTGDRVAPVPPPTPPPAPPSDVDLQSPLDYQVFQRQSRQRGAVRVHNRHS